MSSLSWDFAPSSTNPSVDDEDVGEVDGLGRPEGVSDDHDESSRVDLIEREPLEHEQVETLEREQIEARGRLEELEGVDIELSVQSEREQLEQLEREQLRQLERLDRQRNAHVAAAEHPSEPKPADRPTTDVRTRGAPSAAVADERPEIDAKARAAQFLADASERRALDEVARAVQPAAPATERRELSEPARAARAIVEHRHRNLVEANALLAEARRVLAPIAYRGISDRTYRRRKIILGIGEAVSLAVAFSAAFDVAPLEGLLLSGAIALAFVVAGDLGGILRLTAERSRLSAAVEDGAVHLEPRFLHILYYDRQPWLSIVGGATAGLFALATVSVGVLRAANQGSLGLAAGLGLLTVSLAVAAGLSSWQHASLGSEVIDHLQREEEAAARRLKRAAAARVLRRPQILTAVRREDLEMPSHAPDLDWQAPDTDRQAPNGERRAKRPKRAGRAARERQERRAKSSGLAGAVAARGAVLLAGIPGRFRRSERAAKGTSEEESGPGPGAGGESAGPISAAGFTPPIRIERKFP